MFRRRTILPAFLAVAYVLRAGPAFAAIPTFGEPEHYGAGSHPRYVTAADLDGDGNLDLATANYSSGNVSILLNEGDGTFAAAVNYGAGSGPSALAFADFDGDGDLDLAVTNYFADAVSFLWNNGDGTFVLGGDRVATGDGPWSVVISDLDGDGDQDLAVSNSNTTTISVFSNNGDGTFAAGVTYAVQNVPSSISANDFDGDGDKDLAVTNYFSANVSILLNRGDGSFEAAASYDLEVWPISHAVADFDGDGDLDIVTVNYDSADVTLMLNNGDGTFDKGVQYGVGSHPPSVFAADIDNDGDADVLTANYYGGDVSILLNNGNGTFAGSESVTAGSGPWWVWSADMDRDGDLDLATANYDGSDVSVLLSELATAPGQGTGVPEIVPNEMEVSILPDRCTTDPRVQLLLHAHNSSQVKIGNRPDLSDAEWQAFEPGEDNTETFDWRLPEGDGTKTVYIQFKGPVFDRVSPILSASVVLDEAFLCQTPVEHAHIADLEGHITAAQTNPECLSDFVHADVVPYIVMTDGQTRGWRDLYVDATSTEPGVMVYRFESGSDFAYDDALVHVERVGESMSVHVQDVTDPNIANVLVRVEAADRGTIDTRSVWDVDVDTGKESSETLALAGYKELCATDLVPHPHVGDLFKSPSSDVYYFGRDGKRHAFPTGDVFTSWFDEDAPVMTLASYQLARISVGSNVTLKPGSFARINGQSPIYVVDFGRMLREILSQVWLTLLSTPPLSNLIHTLSPAFVTNYYLPGEPVASSSEPILSGAGESADINDLWPVVEEEETMLTHALRVLDGRVEFQGTPYPSGEVTLRFQIFDANGKAMTAEDLLVQHDKRIHLIIARDDLGHFQHIHPEEAGGVWSVAANFPESGHYVVYVDIAPTGQVPVILRASLAVGQDPINRETKPVPQPDFAFFDNPYRLELLNRDLVAGQELSLEFQLAKDAGSFSDVRTYLGAYAHIVILEHQNSNVYVHSHPAVAPVNGLLKVNARFPYAGRYTLFVQMDVAGTVRTFPITVDVPAP